MFKSFTIAIAFAATAGATGFILWRVVAEPVQNVLPVAFAVLVVLLQHRSMNRLIAQNEILQQSNLALSRDSSAVALSQIQATSQPRVFEGQPADPRDQRLSPAS